MVYSRWGAVRAGRVGGLGEQAPQGGERGVRVGGGLRGAALVGVAL